MIRRSETRREKISTAKFANDYIKIIARHRQIHTHTHTHTQMSTRLLEHCATKVKIDNIPGSINAPKL